MAATTKKADTAAEDVQQEALKSLGPLAQLVGKSAGSLWNIFVRKYIAVGVAEVFGAVWTVWVSIWLLGTASLWLLVPFTLAGLLGYLAIQNLINPHYPALGDVVTRVKDLNKPAPAEIVNSTLAASQYYR